jgi:hypothetical protein
MRGRRKMTIRKNVTIERREAICPERAKEQIDHHPGAK